MTYILKYSVLIIILADSVTGYATMQPTNGASLYNPAQRVFLVRHAERSTIHEKILR